MTPGLHNHSNPPRSPAPDAEHRSPSHLATVSATVRNPLIPVPPDVIMGGAVALIALTIVAGAILALVLYRRHRGS